ncbi:MAG TPA: NAD(P)H-dependent oxidoreductase [Fibrobacteraceae bacterium]|nr:NAD(P)H-dependent oxidoreductase [Fibrobacteraceae bacterium]
MNISLILAHPYNLSFNHGLAQTLRDRLMTAGHQVHFHDLCAENFDPRMPPAELGSDQSQDPLVLQHQADLSQSEGLVVVHPNWWGQPPAVLKGWLDRVLRNGFAYRIGPLPKGGHGPIGLLPVQTLLVFTTSNTPNEAEKAEWGEPLESIWTRYVAGFCCIPRVQRMNFSVVVSSPPELRAQWIQEACATALAEFPA